MSRVHYLQITGHENLQITGHENVIGLRFTYRNATPKP